MSDKCVLDANREAAGLGWREFGITIHRRSGKEGMTASALEFCFFGGRRTSRFASFTYILAPD